MLGRRMGAGEGILVNGYELYRVFTDLEGLEDGIRDRIEDLNTTIEQIEMAGEMGKNQLQKCLVRNPGKAIQRHRDHRHASNKRKFGWESLGKTLKGTGLALVLVVDDERFAPIREQLEQRKMQRNAKDAGQSKPKWLFTPKKASKLRQKWWNSLTQKQQKKHQRKAQKGMVAARRRKSAAARRPAPQLEQHSPTRGLHVDFAGPVLHQHAGDAGELGGL